MKLGETQIIKKECKEQTCCECGDPAKYKHTYLYKNARSNPNSRAYRRDDCSWCEDGNSYACENHKDYVRKEYCPEEMENCSTFTRNERFEHLFLYWETINTGE